MTTDEEKVAAKPKQAKKKRAARKVRLLSGVNFPTDEGMVRAEAGDVIEMPGSVAIGLIARNRAEEA